MVDIHVVNQDVKAQTKRDDDYREQGEAHVIDRDGLRRDITVQPYDDIMRKINTPPPDPSGEQRARRMQEGREMVRLFKQLEQRGATCGDSDDKDRRPILFKGEDTGFKINARLAHQMGLNPDKSEGPDIL